MDGSSAIKYSPTKTQLTLGELKSVNTALKRENRKLTAELEKAQKDRAWALKKLQEVQADNRRMGILLTRLSEEGEADVNPGRSVDQRN